MGLFYVFDNHCHKTVLINMLLTFRAESMSSNWCKPKQLELYYCFIICTSYNNNFCMNCSVHGKNIVCHRYVTVGLFSGYRPSVAYL